MTEPPLVIAECGVTFCPVFEALHAASFPVAECWTAAAFRSLMEMPGTVALVASRGESPAGFILGRFTVDEGEVLTLAVSPAFRRQGAGGLLVQALQDAGRKAGAEKLFLEVSDRNHAALALYQGAGFVQAGRRRRYYPDGSDAEVLVWSAQ